jgi:hypothetical protein
LFGDGPRDGVAEEVRQDYVFLSDWSKVQRVGERFEPNGHLLVVYLPRSGQNSYNTTFSLVEGGRALRSEYSPASTLYDLNYCSTTIPDNDHAKSRMQASIDSTTHVIVDDIRLASEYAKIVREDWVKGPNGEDPQGMITAHIHLIQKDIKQPVMKTYQAPTNFMNPTTGDGNGPASISE